MCSLSAAGAKWISIGSAAGILGTTAPALRKAFEARATPGPDGLVEAEVNGTRGRKQGRTWRVLLAPSGGERGTSPGNAAANEASAAGRAGAELGVGTLAGVDQLHAREAVHGPARDGVVSGEHSVEKIGRTKRVESASSPRRGRSFVVTMADATVAAGPREVTAKIVETATTPDQAGRLGLRLADGVLDLVAELLVEIVREEEGRDGAAAIVDRGGADP